MGSNAVIVAFGFEAGSGKDSCADFLYKAYSASNILRTSFAKCLRAEVHKEVHQIAADYFCPLRDAMEILCHQQGVKFDPFAERTEADPYTKQRQLLQHWGARKRSEHLGYWVEFVAKEVADKKPDLVLISDLRHKNEADWIKSKGGVNVHVYRPDNKLLTGAAASHVSECELVDYNFDFTITNDSTLKQLHKRANKTFHAVTQRNLFI